MHQSLPIGVAPVADAPLPENLCGISMQQLANIARDPNCEAMQMVEVECSQGCGAKFTCIRVFAALTACDECRKKWDEALDLERAKKQWEAICPIGLRDTTRGHECFPRAQYEQLKQWVGDSSLFFFGEPQTGKTRLALLMLKRALLKGKHVGVLWPEDFEAMRTHKAATEVMKHYGSYDVLLLDDVLLTGARDERLSGWLKNLLDYMIRHKRYWILTSNVGGSDYLEQAKKFTDGGKLSATDEARVTALVERLRGHSLVIPFTRVTAAAGEAGF